MPASVSRPGGIAIRAVAAAALFSKPTSGKAMPAVKRMNGDLRHEKAGREEASGPSPAPKKK